MWTVIITPTMEFSESDSDVASTMSYTVENANGIVEEISDHFKDILERSSVKVCSTFALICSKSPIKTNV